LAAACPQSGAVALSTKLVGNGHHLADWAYPL